MTQLPWSQRAILLKAVPELMSGGIADPELHEPLQYSPHGVPTQLLQVAPFCGPGVVVHTARQWGGGGECGSGGGGGGGCMTVLSN